MTLEERIRKWIQEEEKALATLKTIANAESVMCRIEINRVIQDGENHQLKKADCNIRLTMADILMLIERKQNEISTLKNLLPDKKNTNITKIPSPQQRTEAAVRATGNKWANENFNATHK